MYQNKAIVVIFVSALLFAGQATADFKQCFEPCIIGCAFAPDKFACGSKCLLKCIVGESSGPTSDDLECKLGCVVDQCATLGDDLAKVGECMTMCAVKSCGDASSPSPIS